jgi:branched-chain amino acid aminotransferase
VIHRFILHNDAIREAPGPALSAGQVGVLSGWGVFSTLRVIDGVMFAWERHWARVARDAALFNVEIPANPEALRLKLVELIAANNAPDCTLRLAILRNGGGMWEGPPTGRASDVIALTADTKHWGRGVKLAWAEQGRHAASPFAGAKILSWAQNLRLLDMAQARGFDEVILLNERGEAAECTSANIFIANGDQVLTPPLNSGCLPGITREVILTELRVPGFRVCEKALTPADVESAEGVFITSTTRELLPVLEIEGKPIGQGNPARMALQDAFTEYEERYIAARRK